jgi:hypothetical protein
MENTYVIQERFKHEWTRSMVVVESFALEAIAVEVWTNIEKEKINKSSESLKKHTKFSNHVLNNVLSIDGKITPLILGY